LGVVQPFSGAVRLRALLARLGVFPSEERLPVLRMVAVPQFPSPACLDTVATVFSLFWTATARRGSVTSAWTAVYP
jgi:hypothetical protein